METNALDTSYRLGFDCGADFRPNSMTRREAQTMLALALEAHDDEDMDFWNGYLLGIEHRAAA